MNISIKNPFSNEKGIISEFSIEDFRQISFIIENDDDYNLNSYLESKIIGNVNALTKLLLLMKARMQFVGEQFGLQNKGKNINIDLTYLWSNICNMVNDCNTIIIEDGYKFEIDYPSSLLHESEEELLADCVKMISINDNVEINFNEYDIKDKCGIISNLNAKYISLIKDKILELSEYYPIHNKSSNLEGISINLFDNSTFYFIKALFGYYTYDEITEVLFMLSKRINDIQYLNSRTPRDLELLIKLYSEEIEKTNSESKS